MSRNIEEHAARMFAVDMAKHRMIILLDQGLHRHLVFEAREHSWNDRFELITASGSLTITGDRGSHTFRRMPDMFQFFRSNGGSYGINPHYWAEKLPDHGRSVKVYSEAKLCEHLRDLLRDLAEDYRRDLVEWRAEIAESGDDAIEKPEMPKVLRRARELIVDYRFDGLQFKENARQLLNELESIDAASDTWEWNLNDWDFHFLHNLHAIAWGIAQYDNAVRTGLHKVRAPLVAWDTPIPCTAPKKPGGDIRG